VTAVLVERVTPDATSPDGSPPPGVRAHPKAVLAIILAGAAATITLCWQNNPAIRGLGDWLTIVHSAPDSLPSS
jgi:hypothetical protein